MTKEEIFRKHVGFKAGEGVLKAMQEYSDQENKSITQERDQYKSLLSEAVEVVYSLQENKPHGKHLSESFLTKISEIK
jgi:hypothetical protein